MGADVHSCLVVVQNMSYTNAHVFCLILLCLCKEISGSFMQLTLYGQVLHSNQNNIFLSSHSQSQSTVKGERPIPFTFFFFFFTLGAFWH